MKMQKQALVFSVLLLCQLTLVGKDSTEKQWTFVKNHFITHTEKEMKSMKNRAVRLATAITRYAGAATTAAAAGIVINSCVGRNEESFSTIPGHVPGFVKNTATSAYSKAAPYLRPVMPKLQAAGIAVNTKVKDTFPGIHGKISDPNYLVTTLATLGAGYLGWKIGSKVFGSPDWLVSKILGHMKFNKDKAAVASLIRNWKAEQHFEAYMPEAFAPYFNLLKTQHLSVAASKRSDFISEMTPEVIKVVKAYIATYESK
jgi:hypothetical protein